MTKPPFISPGVPPDDGLFSSGRAVRNRFSLSPKHFCPGPPPAAFYLPSGRVVRACFFLRPHRGGSFALQPALRQGPTVPGGEKVYLCITFFRVETLAFRPVFCAFSAFSRSFFVRIAASIKVYLYRNQDPVISARGFPERAEKKALAPQHAARVRPVKKVYLSGGGGAGKARPLPLSCRRQTFQTCNKIA